VTTPGATFAVPMAPINIIAAASADDDPGREVPACGESGAQCAGGFARGAHGRIPAGRARVDEFEDVALPHAGTDV